MKNIKPKSAFTLLELSLVLALIATIVAVVVSVGASTLTSARLSAARSLTAASPVMEIPDLALWLDATSKTAFPTTQPANNTAISNWYDQNPQSGTKNDAIQLTPGNRPQYVMNALNGLPAVYFGSAANNGMTIATTLNVNNNYTIFIVFSGLTTTGRALQAVGNGRNWLLGSWGGKVAHYAEGWVYNSLSITNNKLYITDAVRTSTGSTFYINGLAVASNAFNTPPGNLALGGSGNYYNEAMNGYIGEVIVFTRNISDLERVDVEKYLSKKWRIPLN